jgi:hypothetical protein
MICYNVLRISEGWEKHQPLAQSTKGHFETPWQCSDYLGRLEHLVGHGHGMGLEKIASPETIVLTSNHRVFASTLW